MDIVQITCMCVVSASRRDLQNMIDKTRLLFSSASNFRNFLSGGAMCSFDRLPGERLIFYLRIWESLRRHT